MMKVQAIFASLLVASLFTFFFQSAEAQITGRFTIEKAEWTQQDEALFSEFIKSIGESSCATLDECLKSPVNPWRNSDPAEFTFLSDCADLPYVLRSYFAFKNKLPFTYTSRVFNMDPIPMPTDEQLQIMEISFEEYYKDAEVQNAMTVQYSKSGNFPIGRRSNITKSVNKTVNYYEMFWDMRDTVSSGTYRIHPEMFDNLDLLTGFDYDINSFTDFYPVKIGRDSIRPGTVMYDPSGHVAVVYKVEDDGRIRMMDAHPDNSLTRITYGPSFERSRPQHGAGFKNWRPIKLVNYQVASNNQLIGGEIAATPDIQLPDYSIEQYVGTLPDKDGQWNKGKFIFNNKELEYYTYVRTAMAKGNLKFEPLTELRNLLKDLCSNLQYRNEAVQKTLQKQLQLQPHPQQLPNNIYGTTGEWENYSTPSRDARLKVQVNDIYKQIQNYYNLFNTRSPQLAYQGSNLKWDLSNVYFTEAAQCQISYVKSNGQSVTLNMDQVIDRLFKLSFDPYQSAELRWGDDSYCYGNNSEECRWYQAEKFLRNQHDRTYDAQMSFNLEELESDLMNNSPRPGNGILNPLPVNLKYLFR